MPVQGWPSSARGALARTITMPAPPLAYATGGCSASPGASSSPAAARSSHDMSRVTKPAMPSEGSHSVASDRYRQSLRPHWTWGAPAQRVCGVSTTGIAKGNRCGIPISSRSRGRMRMPSTVGCRFEQSTDTSMRT